MPIPELIDFIRSETQEGATAQSLRVTLMEAGWQEVDIDNALHDVAAGMHPATPGASIHEDLAQVRGMVAHLATRVKGLEASLASFVTTAPAQQLPAQHSLPSPFIGVEHELAGPTGLSLARKILSVIGTALFVGVLALYATELVSDGILTSRDALIIAGAAGVLCYIVSFMRMRRGYAWSASVLAAAAIALWLADVFVAWRPYQFLEWSVAAALGVLLIVLAFVTGRWITRLARA